MSVFCYSQGNISLWGEASSEILQDYLYIKHSVWPVIAARREGGSEGEGLGRGQQAPSSLQGAEQIQFGQQATLIFNVRAWRALLLWVKLGHGP